MLVEFVTVPVFRAIGTGPLEVAYLTARQIITRLIVLYPHRVPNGTKYVMYMNTLADREPPPGMGAAAR